MIATIRSFRSCCAASVFSICLVSTLAEFMQLIDGPVWGKRGAHNEKLSRFGVRSARDHSVTER